LESEGHEVHIDLSNFDSSNGFLPSDLVANLLFDNTNLKGALVYFITLQMQGCNINGMTVIGNVSMSNENYYYDPDKNPNTVMSINDGKYTELDLSEAGGVFSEYQFLIDGGAILTPDMIYLITGKYPEGTDTEPDQDELNNIDTSFDEHNPLLDYIPDVAPQGTDTGLSVDAEYPQALPDNVFTNGSMPPAPSSIPSFSWALLMNWSSDTINKENLTNRIRDNLQRNIERLQEQNFYIGNTYEMRELLNYFWYASNNENEEDLRGELSKIIQEYPAEFFIKTFLVDHPDILSELDWSEHDFITAISEVYKYRPQFLSDLHEYIKDGPTRDNIFSTYLTVVLADRLPNLINSESEDELFELLTEFGKILSDTSDQFAQGVCDGLQTILNENGLSYVIKPESLKSGLQDWNNGESKVNVARAIYSILDIAR
jgi:hypothetical protein